MVAKSFANALYWALISAAGVTRAAVEVAVAVACARAWRAFVTVAARALSSTRISSSRPGSNSRPLFHGPGRNRRSERPKRLFGLCSRISQNPHRSKRHPPCVLSLELSAFRAILASTFHAGAGRSRHAAVHLLGRRLDRLADRIPNSALSGTFDNSLHDAGSNFQLSAKSDSAIAFFFPFVKMPLPARKTSPRD